MSRARPESIAWYHTDSEDEPDAHRLAWEKEGTQTPTFERDGLELADTDNTEAWYYWRQLHEADNEVAGPNRYRDTMGIQAYIRGISSTPGWTSGASPIGIFIVDGGRKLGLSIGSDLQLIDPTTGDVIKTVKENHPWLTGRVYGLKKVGSAKWIVTVDGQVADTVSYNLAPVVTASDAFPARAGIGSLDSTGESRAIYEAWEPVLNLEFPPTWKFEKWLLNMPPLLQKVWKVADTAALRATVGLVQQGISILEEVWYSLTAERIDIEPFYANGDRLPNQEDPPWSQLTSWVSIVRQRIRHASPGTNSFVGHRADFTIPSVALPTDIETTGSWELVVRTLTSKDAQGRVGPTIRVRDGTKGIYAQLYADPAATDRWVWALTDAAILPTVPVNPLGEPWRVNIYEQHKVEVQVFAPNHVLLLVDDQIVDRVAYSAFPADANPATVFLGAVGNAAPSGAVVTFDAEHLTAVQRLSDLNRRELFLQNALERQMFTSGVDRNDELESWMRHHYETQGARGQTNDIVIEMKRLCNSENVWVTLDSSYAGWVLEASYPETTPIFLEQQGVLRDIYVEFVRECPNFSDQELADLAAQHLVPLSSQDLQYWIARVAITNGVITVPSPGVSRIPVDDVDPFDVGDTVTIRNVANTVREDTTVQGVGPTYLIVDLLSGTYAVGSIVRLVLAQT